MATNEKPKVAINAQTDASTKERCVKDVRPPSLVIPSDADLFQDIAAGKPNIKFLRSHLFDEGYLSESQIMRIIKRGTEVMAEEPNLLELPAPIVICGNIHGQFYDLLKLFEVSGKPPPEQRYLFLGDYVDRGYFSIECFIYLLALKICYPDSIYMLRGNHECRHLTKHFTFRLECKYKYGVEVYDACMEAFDALATAAVVNKQFFCVHGGISPELQDVANVNKFNRFQEPPKRGLMCDLLWSDPTEDFGNDNAAHFTANSARGCSYRFSYDAVCSFLQNNKLLSVIRGHEAQDAGYRLYKKTPKSEFPALITLFSAPNYVDVYNNKGATLKYDGKVLNIRQYNCSTHPYYLPKFMDAFDWSLPFVGQNVTELLLSILNLPSMDDKLGILNDSQREGMERERIRKRAILSNKIRAVGRVGKMFTTVRNERETLTELINAMGTDVIPSSYLSLGHEELKKAIQTFEDAKVCDRINEMAPPLDEDSDAASVVSGGGSFTENGAGMIASSSSVQSTLERASEKNSQAMSEDKNKALTEHKGPVNLLCNCFAR